MYNFAQAILPQERSCECRCQGRYSVRNMAQPWEFVHNPQPSGDGVSLIPQAWEPVENVLLPAEILLLLAGLQTRGSILFQGSLWRLISVNRHPFPKLVFRPRTERNIVLKVYASLIRTTVRWHAWHCKLMCHIIKRSLI